MSNPKYPNAPDAEPDLNPRVGNMPYGAHVYMGPTGGPEPHYNQARQPSVMVNPGLGGGAIQTPEAAVDKMSRAQVEHMHRVSNAFTKRMEHKYRRGQAEHGGDLHHKSVSFLLDAAIEEAIDQVVYLLTLAEVLEGEQP